MARAARTCATCVPRGTSPSGRQLCPARGVSRGIASYVNPSPAPGRHFGIGRGTGRRQRIPLMMLNHRRPIQTSMSCAAPEGAWREAAARFPQAYAMGLQHLSPQGAWLATRSRHETCRDGARRAKTTEGTVEVRDLPSWVPWASVADLRSEVPVVTRSRVRVMDRSSLPVMPAARQAPRVNKLTHDTRLSPPVGHGRGTRE